MHFYFILLYFVTEIVSIFSPLLNPTSKSQEKIALIYIEFVAGDD